MRTVKALGDVLGRTNADRSAMGRAGELGVERLDMQNALNEITERIDRGHGRCYVCGQPDRDTDADAVTRCRATR
jgi:hypothetical protein